MISSIGRITILVHDYDEALEFYGNILGFVPIFDMVFDDGRRLLHVGPRGDKGAGIWFLKAETDEQAKQVGRQTAGAPCLVLYTDDCHATYEDLKEKGVKFIGDVHDTDDDRLIHFNDPYGNEIILVEVKKK